jgi:hypothetical protein
MRTNLIKHNWLSRFWLVCPMHLVGSAKHVAITLVSCASVRKEPHHRQQDEHRAIRYAIALPHRPPLNSLCNKEPTN